MKKILILIIGLICLLPITGHAVKLSNNYTNLKDTVKAIGLTQNKKGYDEKSDNVEIILFYGSGCPHCHDFIKFLNDLVLEYPHITLKAYEVWYDSSNSKLMEEVGKEIGVDARGVPFIIIGKKNFMGFGTSMESEVKDTIKTVYETPVDKRESYFSTTKVSNKKTTTTKATKTTTTVPTTTTTVYRALEENTTTTAANNKQEEQEEKKESLLSKYKYAFIAAWVIVIGAFAFIIIKGKKNNE